MNMPESEIDPQVWDKYVAAHKAEKYGATPDDRATGRTNRITIETQEKMKREDRIRARVASAFSARKDQPVTPIVVNSAATAPRQAPTRTTPQPTPPTAPQPSQAPAEPTVGTSLRKRDSKAELTAARYQHARALQIERYAPTKELRAGGYADRIAIEAREGFGSNPRERRRADNTVASLQTATVHAQAAGAKKLAKHQTKIARQDTRAESTRAATAERRQGHQPPAKPKGLARVYEFPATRREREHLHAIHDAKTATNPEYAARDAQHDRDRKAGAAEFAHQQEYNAVFAPQRARDYLANEAVKEQAERDALKVQAPKPEATAATKPEVERSKSINIEESLKADLTAAQRRDAAMSPDQREEALRAHQQDVKDYIAEQERKHGAPQRDTSKEQPAPTADPSASAAARQAELDEMTDRAGAEAADRHEDQIDRQSDLNAEHVEAMRTDREAKQHTKTPEVDNVPKDQKPDQTRVSISETQSKPSHQRNPDLAKAAENARSSKEQSHNFGGVRDHSQTPKRDNSPGR